MKYLRQRRTRYESVEEICMWYGYYVSIARKKAVMAGIKIKIEKDRKYYERIREIIRRLAVPATVYFDVLFENPIDVKRGKGWMYPYLSYLASDTAMYVFQGRMAEYKKQIGIYDDMLRYVRECSVVNIEAWFGGSFWEGYFSLHRALDRLDDISDTQLFQIFAEDPVFTPIFIVTHRDWKRFCVRNIKNSLVKELKVRCKEELNLLQGRFIRERFLEARGRKRRVAQLKYVKQHDERWGKIWKMLS